MACREQANKPKTQTGVARVRFLSCVLEEQDKHAVFETTSSVQLTMRNTDTLYKKKIEKEYEHAPEVGAGELPVLLKIVVGVFPEDDIPSTMSGGNFEFEMHFKEREGDGKMKAVLSHTKAPRRFANSSSKTIDSDELEIINAAFHFARQWVESLGYIPKEFIYE